MNGFFNHLVSKQTNPSANISPRLKGRFESFAGFQHSSFNEVAEDKESAKPLADKAVHADKTSIANIPEISLPKQPDQSADNQQENDATIEGTLIAQPLLSKINNNLINDIADAAKKNSDPLQTEENLALKANSFDTVVDKPDATEKDSSTYKEINTEAKNREQQQDVFSLQQNIQLTPQLELNMAVINAFKQLYKNEVPENNLTTQPASTIKVNIGRIDVRAVTQQTSSKEISRPKAGMSLDDFLKKKNGTN